MQKELVRRSFNQVGFAPLVIVVLVAVVLGGGYFTYTNYSNLSRVIPRDNQTQSVPIQTTKTPTPYTKSEELTPQEASKILPLLNKEYTNLRGFSIKYPANWKITESNYLNSVTLTNENGTVSINISEGQYPYGFTGESNFKEQELKIVIDGKEYITKEFTRDSGAYVDFKVEKGTKSFNILFGSDYPALTTQPSLENYLSNKNTILYILSTFRFD